MAKARPQQFTFRPMDEADYDVLPRLISGPGEASLVFWETADPTSLQAIRDLLQARQDQTVAESRGRVVGLGALYEVEEGKQGYVGPVLVDPRYRGHGVGSRLMSHLLDTAFRRHRLREVRARVLGENEDGIVLFSEMGFIPYSNEERPGRDGRNHVVVQMRINRRAHEDND